MQVSFLSLPREPFYNIGLWSLCMQCFFSTPIDFHPKMTSAPLLQACDYNLQLDASGHNNSSEQCWA